jgi:hypothetical protein
MARQTKPALKSLGELSQREPVIVGWSAKKKGSF